MRVAARRALVDDLDEIAALATSFRDEQREARGGVLWSLREAPQAGGQYERHLDEPGVLIVVGTIDDVVLGYAICDLEVIRDGSKIGRITELFVAPEARAVSVGDDMINELTDWCRSQGCIGVDAFALPGERLTKNFFEAHGFVARLLTMHHRFET